MLIENPPLPLRHGEGEHVVTVGRWPVWHREPAAGARDHPSGRDQQERAARDDAGIHVEPAPIHQRSSLIVFGGTHSHESLYSSSIEMNLRRARIDQKAIIPPKPVSRA